MRVALVHNAVSDVGAPDERDVPVQLKAVAVALREPGHRVAEVPGTLDLPALGG